MVRLNQNETSDKIEDFVFWHFLQHKDPNCIVDYKLIHRYGRVLWEDLSHSIVENMGDTMVRSISDSIDPIRSKRVLKGL